MKAAGYSTVPLAKKLGIKSATSIKVVNAPEYYYNLFNDLPGDLKEVVKGTQKVDFLHYFTMNRSYFLRDIRKLKSSIRKNGALWISWPKKASGIITDIDENFIREIALEIGLVDVKVCAIDNIWSGLKLVIPVKERK